MTRRRTRPEPRPRTSTVATAIAFVLLRNRPPRRPSSTLRALEPSDHFFEGLKDIAGGSSGRLEARQATIDELAMNESLLETFDSVFFAFRCLSISKTTWIS